MSRIETALLYVDHPAVAFSKLVTKLNERLEQFDVELSAIHSQDPSKLVLRGPGLRVLISAKYGALPAESFGDALESPLSAPFRGPLSETLVRHKMHVMVSVLPAVAFSEMTAGQYLIATRVAHAAATLVAEWHQPAAVHWRQSNQLITGEKYQSLADDPTPWALLAQAKIIPTITENGADAHDIYMDGARHFIGRPIVFGNTTAPVEQAFAASLAFLRFAIENGAPIEDGHTFGQTEGEEISVLHAPASEQHPHGWYELAAKSLPIAVSAESAREATQQYRAFDRQQNRTRSLAISYLMLVILPPIGVLLMVSNALFKPNAGRTAFIASSSMAATILVAAMTFVTLEGESVAILETPNTIATQTLSE